MGCGTSTDQQQRQAPAEQASNAYRDGSEREELDPEEVDSNGDLPRSALKRRDSVAQKASEPGSFVTAVKTMYNVRKAKLNGANEDLDQYRDEIKQSIPTLSRKDRHRIQEWVNELGRANPGDVYEEIPPPPTRSGASSRGKMASAGPSGELSATPLSGGSDAKTGHLSGPQSGVPSANQSPYGDAQLNGDAELPNQPPGAVPILEVTVTEETMPAGRRHTQATVRSPNSFLSRTDLSSTMTSSVSALQSPRSEAGQMLMMDVSERPSFSDSDSDCYDDNRPPTKLDLGQ